jgi:hypothetical protein
MPCLLLLLLLQLGLPHHSMVLHLPAGLPASLEQQALSAAWQPPCKLPCLLLMLLLQALLLEWRLRQ